jgi:hypothetical protein
MMCTYQCLPVGSVEQSRSRPLRAGISRSDWRGTGEITGTNGATGNGNRVSSARGWGTIFVETRRLRTRPCAIRKIGTPIARKQPPSDPNRVQPS